MSGGDGMTVKRLVGADRGAAAPNASCHYCGGEGTMRPPGACARCWPEDRGAEHLGCDPREFDDDEEFALPEGIAATALVMAEVGRISEASGVGLEDLARAFLTVRPELGDDDQALGVLESIARQSRELGVEAPTLAAMLVEASRKPADREAPAAKNQVVLAGGERTPALPPGRDLTSGEVDPEAARVVGEGRARYHLDTLAELDAESRRPAPPPRPVLGKMLALSAAAMMLAVGRDDEEPAPAPRPPGRAPGTRTLPCPSPVTRRPLESPQGPGCRSAGCRTLADCLCACRRCRTSCAARKAPRGAA